VLEDLNVTPIFHALVFIFFPYLWGRGHLELKTQFHLL